MTLLEAQRIGNSRDESIAMQVEHPIRLISGRQHSDLPVHIRILSRVRFGVTECWHYCGPTNHFGYGRFSLGARTVMAHRASYEAFKGRIPSGKIVLHSCDNPSCVNPDHLSVGTHADNRRDCITKGRWKLRKRRLDFDHQNNRVTPGALAKIYQGRRSGLSYAAISKQLGLSAMTVWTAVNRRFGGRK